MSIVVTDCRSSSAAMGYFLSFCILGCIALTVEAHSGHHDDHPRYVRMKSVGEDANKQQAHTISDHRFFLHEIFTKYGHNGQMTFEGFEHLLESLGLGNIIITDHDVTAHKQEDAFRSTHDSHDHPKKESGDHEGTQGKSKHVAPPSHTTSKSTSDGKTSDPTPLPVTTSRNRLRLQHKPQTPTVGGPPKIQESATTTNFPTDKSVTTTTVNGSSAEDLYHYNLPEAYIPELLVNISSLVDQHEELPNEPQEFVIEQCLSPKEILETFGINQTSSLNPVSFLHLCPAIIYELDQGHCMFRDLSHRKQKSLATLHQWLYALVAVLAISLCGLLSVAVIPIMQKWFYQTLLQFLVGLAVGSLSGDALLHLMPHAMLPGEGGHGNSSLLMEVAERTAVWRGFCALAGVLFFFVAERLLAVITARNKRRSQQEDSQTAVAYDVGRVGQKLSQYRKDSSVELGDKEMLRMLSSGPQANPELTSSDFHGGHGHSHEMPESITAVAWMVIMGDGLHNFCDGLAIGAAFASGIEGGISTTVAVFCHELPHELGDFAMLLRTGMGVRRALLYNVLSSGLCLAGAALGLCLGGVTSATGWVFAVTAGIFIYVALVDMLPELSVSHDRNSNPLHQLAIQVLGISTGVSIMLIIANYEQDLQSIVS